jgi:hypothetical protein
MVIVAAAPLPAQNSPSKPRSTRRQKAEIFEGGLPDFVCREMIHSRTEADPGWRAPLGQGPRAAWVYEAEYTDYRK